MIQSFADKDTERLWNRERVRSIDSRIHSVALRKLRQLGYAQTLDELRIPPGNRLEALKVISGVSSAFESTTSGGSVFGGPPRGQRRLRSLTTTDKLPPVHPGEILMEDFLKEMEITQHKLAVSIGVPPRRINEIVHGKRAITADTALRLAKFFGMSPQFWLGLQAQYDLDVAEDKTLAEIERIQPLQAASA